MNFYKTTAGSWILGSGTFSAGDFYRTDNADGTINLTCKFNPSIVYKNMSKTAFKDANGNFYADDLTFEAATATFFVEASSGGGAISLPISQSDVSGLADSLLAKVDTSKLGAANGVAELGADGKVKPAQINLTGAEVISVTNQAARLALASSDHFRIVLQGDTNWLWAINKDLAPATAGNWVDCGSAGSSIVKVNNKTGPDVTLNASDVSALALSSVLAKGDILVGTGNGAVARVVAGLDGQVLGYDSTQNTGLKPISVAAATGVQASYMRASAGGSQLCSSGNIITLSPVISAGSDITCVSNCFLLKANRTYALRGSLGGVNFTTTGNSYMYAQWRVGQTGGSGALLGNAANVEASAQSSQNQRCVYIAEAEYTPTTDTWVHFEVTSVGTNVNIGSGPGNAASAWIEVIAGAAAVTGSYTEYGMVKLASDTSIPSAGSTINLGTSLSSGTIPYSNGVWTLIAGRTYRLRGSLGVTSVTDTNIVYQWYNVTSAGYIGNIGLGRSMASTGGNTYTPAEHYITPTVTTQVCLKTISSNAALRADYSFAVVEQMTASAITQMIGASSTANGITGTTPIPLAGQEKAYLRGDGTWDNMAWTAYTPTITGSVSNPTLATTKTLIARYRVIGKSLQIAFTYYAANNAGSANGSGAYLFSLPAGFTINTTVAILASAVNSTVGSMSGVDASTLGTGLSGHAMSPTGSAPIVVVGTSTTTIGLFIGFSSSGTVYNTLIGSAINQMTNTGCYYKFTAEIPIL